MSAPSQARARRRGPAAARPPEREATGPPPADGRDPAAVALALAPHLVPADPAARAHELHLRLLDHYGPPPPRAGLDPLSELVLTILSQHTSDRNSERAFASLRARFPTWEAVRDADVAEVAAAIQSGGLAWQKAPRIQRILRELGEKHGELSLDFLRELPLEEARAYLTGLDGVGPKTAACVLLFACGLPALPVDTHVHRVSRRLGLIGPRESAERAHALLEAMVPAELVYPFHMNLIRHGREICKAPRPRCAACPLADLCPKVGVAPTPG